MSAYLAALFKDIHQKTGLNFVYMYDQFEYRRMIDGVWTSVELIVLCLICSIIIGLIATTVGRIFESHNFDFLFCCWIKRRGAWRDGPKK